MASEAEISGPRNPPPITANSAPSDAECQARLQAIKEQIERTRREKLQAMLEAERAQSPGRTYSVVGGEDVWREKAIAWLKTYPRSQRLERIAQARERTDPIARELWDDLRQELGL